MNPRPVRPGAPLSQGLLALGSISLAVGLAVWQQRMLGRTQTASVTAAERPNVTFADLRRLPSAK